jgi:hypothetical protein
MQKINIIYKTIILAQMTLFCPIMVVMTVSSSSYGMDRSERATYASVGISVSTVAEKKISIVDSVHIQ